MPTCGGNQSKQVIGLIPAGGLAARIAPLPVSKELYPIGFRTVEGDSGLRPKVVCHYLLEKMQLAGIDRAYIILRQGKWDIPAYLGDGSMLGIHLAYLMMRLPYGAPYTLDQAYPFVQDCIVALGFPDIIFQPDDAFVQLLGRQAASEADIVLGLFPVDQPHKMDMVELDDDGRVRQIVIKPAQTHLRYTWFIAVWTPVFTRFMHDYLASIQITATKSLDEKNGSACREIFVGDVIRVALQNGLRVESVIFAQGTYVDIGTPEDLVRAVRGDGSLWGMVWNPLAPDTPR
ncbi:MAG: sugar phosphate nucleotidyltransferase [Chloroflexota bacterium]